MSRCMLLKRSETCMTLPTPLPSRGAYSITVTRYHLPGHHINSLFNDVPPQVTLIGQGILVMQKEADKANKALQQQESELAQFQSLGWLWYPFRNKCYTLKERAGNYNFCPFQVNHVCVWYLFSNKLLG